MPDPSSLMTLAGISSILGLLGILAYFYFIVQARSLERSVRETVEGEGLFNADQVLAILKEFKTDEKRLEALVHLTNLDKEKASAVLSKVNGRIDIEKLQQTSQGHSRKIAGIAGSFFLAIGLFGLLATEPEMAHAPVPLSPSDGVVFTDYPRLLVIVWVAVDEAIGYLVNVEIQDPQTSEWHPHPFSYGEKSTIEPRLKMEFVGSQPGRWRVAARLKNGEIGEFSAWSYFEFRDATQSQDHGSEDDPTGSGL